MNTVIVSALISAIVSLICGLIVYNNTGKKLESYKKDMQSRDDSYEITMRIFKQINSLYNAIYNSDGAIQYAVIDKQLAIRAQGDLSLADAKLFIPDKLQKDMDEILDNISDFAYTIYDQLDTKRNGYSDDYDKKMEDLYKKKSKSLEQINILFENLMREIRNTYKIFPANT